MFNIILVIHILLAVTLIGVVLIQKSEGGGLGIGGGGGGMSGFMTGRSTANLLTRTTAILAGLFMFTSIVLAILAARQHASPSSILDQIQTPVPQTQGSAPSNSAPKGTPPAAPAQPQQPSVPLAK